MHQFLKFILFL